MSLGIVALLAYANLAKAEAWHSPHDERDSIGAHSVAHVAESKRRPLIIPYMCSKDDR